MDDAHAKYPDDHEENNFKEMPVSVIGDLEEHQFPGAERVHCRKRHGGYERTKEATP